MKTGPEVVKLINQCILGIFDEQGDGSEGDTERFRFVDGEVEGLEFFEEADEFPWQDDQPNDASGNDDCIE